MFGWLNVVVDYLDEYEKIDLLYVFIVFFMFVKFFGNFLVSINFYLVLINLLENENLSFVM